MNYEDNLTAERPTFVTHLECAPTGERHEADQIAQPVARRQAAAGALRPRRACAGPSPRRAGDAGRPTSGATASSCRCGARPTSSASARAVTPLIPLPKLAQRLGGGELLVKDEGRLPTGSFKARGLVLAVVDGEGARRQAHRDADQRQRRRGARRLRRARRHRVHVFCPDDTPEVNVREIALQGAERLSRQRPDQRLRQDRRRGQGRGGWFDVSTLKEPYRIEGKKTMGLELAEQLGWQLPDVILYPTGGGTGLIGMWKAFDELEAIGWIGTKRPRMVAVQATGCAPIVRAFEAGRGARAALGERAHRRRRHPRAAGDRRFPDPARGARERRLRDRRRRRRDPSGARSRWRARRASCCARKAPPPSRLRAEPRRRPRRADRPGGAVQLRQRPEVSAAGDRRASSTARADRLRGALNAAKLRDSSRGPKRLDALGPSATTSPRAEQPAVLQKAPEQKNAGRWR